jgi:alpha-ketoglutarate-dependent sulfate ester dioxygenase
MNAHAVEFETVSVAVLQALLREHRVVLLRNASSDARVLRRLARSLSRGIAGGRDDYQLRTEVAHERDQWHSDLAFIDRPPVIGVARLVEPAHPLAHTRWIDMVHAYESLPFATRSILDDLRALHTGTGHGGRLVFQTTHPVVTVHPFTGRRSLFLGQSIRRFIGLSKGDSDDLLAHLLDHVVDGPQLTIPWAQGDVLVWDNTATVHDTLDGFGAAASVEALAFAGRTPLGVDGSTSRARHGSSHMLAVAAS